MTTKNTTPAVPIRCNSTRLETVGEVMELADDYVCYISNSATVADNGRRAALLAAITKLVSDRDALLSAMTTISTAQQSVLLLEYVHGIARAAIQKVTK